MDLSYLCLSDTTGHIACFLKVGAGGLEFVSGTPGSSEKIAFALRELAAHGVHARHEQIAADRIEVDRVQIGPEDPLYLAGCAEEFRVRGWKAFIYPLPKAEIWRKLHELPVPPELRTAFAERLNALPEEALTELQGHLDRAETDFARIYHTP